MSKVVYFTARQKVLEVLAAGAPIAFTEVDVSTFVPEGATALIAFTELEQIGAAVPGDYATSRKQKNAAQGPCAQDSIFPTVGGALKIANDNAIIPLTTARKFEYDLNSTFGALTFNIRVYVLGYIL